MNVLQYLIMITQNIKDGAAALWEIASAVPVASGSIAVIVAVAVIYLIVGR